MKKRILVVDDHVVVRTGLRALLSMNPEYEVVGEAASGEDSLQLAAELRPDLILMDLNMSGMNGIEATRKLKELINGIKVLILTMHEDIALLREALRAGASGFILKRAAEADLLHAVRTALQGELYVQPSMLPLLVPDLSPQEAASRPVEATLTFREIDVLRLLARGHTNGQVADTLNISVRTVEAHRANLMNKLSLRSRVELVNYAEKQRLI